MSVLTDEVAKPVWLKEVLFKFLWLMSHPGLMGLALPAVVEELHRFVFVQLTIENYATVKPESIKSSSLYVLGTLA